MTFLLDANVLSEATKPGPDAGVLRWLAENQVESCKSSVVMGEIEIGLLLLDHRLRRRQILLWFEGLRASTEVLPFDQEVARSWARLVSGLQGKGVRLPIKDSMIAATALVHGLTVVIRNVRDFERAGVKLVNPFSGD